MKSISNKKKKGEKAKQKRLAAGSLPPGSLVYTGNREYLPTKIYSVRFNESDISDKKTIDDFPTYAPLEEDAIIWVDTRSLHDTPLIERLGNAYKVPPLALEDVLDTHQRAKMEEHGEELFFILHDLKFNKEQITLISEQISIYVGRKFVLSFQEDPDDTFQEVRRRIQNSRGRVRQKGSDYLMYSLIDIIVDGYFSVLDEMEQMAVDIETDFYQHTEVSDLKNILFNLKRALSTFRSRILPLRDAINRLYRCESTLVEETTRPYLGDVADHVAQSIDIADNLRDQLSNLEALLSAEAGNRLNEVMRLLTVINTIFIPLTFIVGVYGMNFDNMPELRMQYAYFVVLGFMGALTIGMLVYFRINKWI